MATLKIKKCKMCGEEFKTNVSTQRVCSFNCAVDLAEKEKAKKKERQRKELRKKVQENDKRHQLALTQKVFNALRREEELQWYRNRGLEPVCISCGKPKGNDTWSCGHFKSVGSNSALRFDERNTYLQHNWRCNSQKSGDIVNFRKGILHRFDNGQEILDYLDNHEKIKNWTCEELIEMRKEFNRRLRELMKNSL